MLVAITGGTGFVGRYLVLENLEAGNSVRVLTRRSSSAVELPDAVKLYRADLTQDIEILPSFIDGADVVFHCAGENISEDDMYGVNVQGTRNLLDAASNSIGHWVQLSSVGVYGRCRDAVITEESPLRPVGAYEETKAEADRLVTEASTRHGVHCTILRPSIVFGPDMPNRSLVELAAMIKRRLFFFVGAEGASANYIHVKNVIEALMRCARVQHDRGRVYNLSDWCTFEKFVEIIAHCVGKTTPKLRLPEHPVRWIVRTLEVVPGMPLSSSRIDALVNRCKYPSTRIEQELHYTHKISMEEGIRESIASWQL